MRLESNLGAISGRLARLQRRDVPVALERTLHRPEWLALARESAKRSLLAVADPAHRQFIDPFLATLERFLFKDGFGLRLHTPSELRTTEFSLDNFIAGKQGSRRASEPTAAGQKIQTVLAGPVVGQDLFSQSVNELDDLVTEWVATEKDKDKRDWSKSDEEIAHFIVTALTTPWGQEWTVKNGKNRGRTVADVFLPHITAFLSRQQAGPVAPTILHAWFEVVRAGWIEMVRAHLPGMFHAELASTRGDLAL